jgi:phospholipid N-methyltransferase
MTEYPNTGVLWTTKEKKHPKAPDRYGQIELERDFLRNLLENSKGLVVIKLDAWERESRNGTFLSLKVNTFKKEVTEERMPFDE